MELVKLSRFSDSRGVLLTGITESHLGKSIKEVVVSRTHRGEIRGGHSHKFKVEWFLVLSGKTRLILRDLVSGEEESVELDKESLTLVKVPPQTYHEIKNIGKNDLCPLECSSEEYLTERPDSYRLEKRVFVTA